MMDTIGGEIEKWTREIKTHATQLKDKKLLHDIFELEYYLLMIRNGISVNEDSGVADYIMERDFSDDLNKWKEESYRLLVEE